MLENKPLGFVGQAAPSILKDIQALNQTNKTQPATTNDSLATKDSVKISSVTAPQNPFNIWDMVNLTSDDNVTYTPSNFKRTELCNYKIDDQGDTNSCGTTSLTSVLKYFGVNVKDHFEVDKTIRSTRFDMFTAPGDIVNYANSKGLNAGFKKNSNLDEVASFIDKGVPVMVLIDSGTQYDFNMHWVVITGYEKDDKNKIANVVISDPAGGYTRTQDVESFSERWGNIKVGSEKLPLVGGKISLKTGYNNLIIPIAPKNKGITLPDGKVASSKDIKIPHEMDTIQGYGSRVVAKSALLLDKTIGLGEKAYKTTSNFFKGLFS